MAKLLSVEDVKEIRTKLEDGYRGPWLVTTVWRLLEHVEERERLATEQYRTANP